MKNRIIKIAFLCGGILLQGCVNSPVGNQIVINDKATKKGEHRDINEKEKHEVALGTYYHKNVILRKYKIYKQPTMQAYIDYVGNKLAVNSQRNYFNYKFILLDSPKVNAFSLPGGYIYLTRGLLAYLNSEAELASVLGHEIAHVDMGHGVKRRTRNGLAKKNVLRRIFSYKNDFREELEADKVAIQYLAKSGYDVSGIADVIMLLNNQRLFSKKHNTVDLQTSFSKNLSNNERYKHAVKIIEKYNQAESGRLSQDNRFLRVFDGLRFGEAQGKGVYYANNYYNSNLDLSVIFPKSWTIKHIANAVVAFSPDNQQNIQLQIDTLSPDLRIEEYLNFAYQNFRKTRTIDLGLILGKAHSGVGVVTNKAKSMYMDALVSVIYYKNKSLVFYGQGNDGNLPEKAFNELLDNIHVMTPDERLRANGQKIALVTATKGDTYAALAEKFMRTELPEIQLRLLNNALHKEEPKVGQLVKIIQ